MNTFLLKQFPHRISLSQAAEITGYHQDYLGRLCRTGQLRAAKIGRNWYTTKAEIENFLMDGDLMTDKNSDTNTEQVFHSNLESGSMVPSIDGVNPTMVTNVTVREVAELPIKLQPKSATYKHSQTVQTMIAKMKLDALQKEVLQMAGAIEQLNNRVDEHSEVLARHEKLLAQRIDLRELYAGGLDMAEQLNQSFEVYSFERPEKSITEHGVAPWILQVTSWSAVLGVVAVALGFLVWGLAQTDSPAAQSITLYEPLPATTNLVIDPMLNPQVAGEAVTPEMESQAEPLLNDVP